MHLSLEEIEKYLRNPQKGKVEDHLSECDQCSALAEGLKLVSIGEMEESKDKIKAEIERRIDVKPVPLFPKALWASAASIAIAIGLLFFAKNLNDDPDRFVVEQLASYDTPINQERGTSSDQQWSNFVIEYNAKNFNQAAIAAKNLQYSKLEGYHKFYIGISFLKRDTPDYESASAMLSDVAKSESRLADTATWFLALTYYQSGKIDECKSLLTALPENSKYKQESEEFMELIEKD